MRNAYMPMFTGEYNRLRVWRYDTSVPWPMAAGSCGARLVCTPNGILHFSFSSDTVINTCIIHFEVTRFFIHAAGQRILHTRIRFLTEKET